MWPLSFISEENFTKHVQATIINYGEKLEPYNLIKFNSNIIDPIKLVFDKTVYRFTWDEIVKNEIFRQRDKSNNNDIGYFHQKLFQFIDNCTIPTTGWDVVFNKDSGIVLPDGDVVHTVNVEMKNKHNTMNSTATSKTYMKMQGQLLSDDDCACFLVEAIAKRSQNIPWQVSVDGVQHKHKRIRRLSIDRFYSFVTEQEDAFYKMCMVLPEVIQNVVDGMAENVVPHDSVLGELKDMAKKKEGSFVVALYALGFGSYLGFA